MSVLKFTTMANKKETSKKVARIASELLRNSKSSQKVKKVAASDLTQTTDRVKTSKSKPKKK